MSSVRIGLKKAAGWLKGVCFHPACVVLLFTNPARQIQLARCEDQLSLLPGQDSQWKDLNLSGIGIKYHNQGCIVTTPVFMIPSLWFFTSGRGVFSQVLLKFLKKSQAIKNRTCQCGPYVLKLELLNTVRTLGPSFKNRNNMLSLVTGVEKHTFPSSYHFLSTTWQSTHQEL